MAQNTNLNASPYFDDFDSTKNYHRVLFKPGTPIQARELTTLQSILQDQIEKFGKHFFKEGSVVIPGQTAYDSDYFYVQVDSSHLGIPISAYFSKLVGKFIKGETSGVEALVENYILDSTSENGNFTLYVKYQTSGTNGSQLSFLDGENLILLSNLNYGVSTITKDSTFATTIISNSTGTASAAKIQNGVYFIRGFFIDVPSQTIILDQYGNIPSYRVGLFIEESISVASQKSPDLFDNAKGFSNFAAPGADRFKITTTLIKKSLDDFNDENFVELIRIEKGIVKKFVKDTQYNLIRDELARRTYDESGDYYVSPFKVIPKECLNNKVGNNGVYFEKQVTQSGNIPSDDFVTLQVSPGKAYVRGYEIETLDTTSIDVLKPRTKDYSQNESIPFTLGKQIEVNNVHGSLPVGFGTTSIVNLYSNRTSTGGSPSGLLVGVARIYDFKLKNAEYLNDATKFETSLYDMQTYTYLTLNTDTTLTVPCFIEGNNSGANGYLVQNVSSNQVILYQVSGSFSVNESIKINGILDSKTIVAVRDYNLSDVHQLVGTHPSFPFSSDPILSKQINIAPQGASFTISAASGSASTVTAGSNTFTVGIKTGDIISYTKTGETLPTFNRVKTISTTANSIVLEATTSVTGVSNGTLPGSQLVTSSLVKVTSEVLNSTKSFLYSSLQYPNVSNVDFTGTDIIVKKSYLISVSSGAYSNVLESNVNFSLEPFDEEDYTLTFISTGNIETLTNQKLLVSGNTITLQSLSESGSAVLTVTFKKKNVKSRKKTFTRCKSLIVDRSSQNSSGAGSTTLADGLTYSSVYGTRVQDDKICLNVPDVITVLGVYESNDSNNPDLPKLTLTELSSNINNAVIGEKVFGSDSKTCGIVVLTNGTNQIEFVYGNENSFIVNESIVFEESKITAKVSAFIEGDRNILDTYVLNENQKAEYADYSFIYRKLDTAAPSRKLKIIFSHYDFESNDDGDFVSVNSYDIARYKDDLPFVDGQICSDIIDLRPRVPVYDLATATKSPFEFDSRDFKSLSNSAPLPFAKDKNLNLSYYYYLGRIDKVFLTKDGKFVINNGVAALYPKEPNNIDNALEVATIKLPPYVFDVGEIQVNTASHKRYRMKDIQKLEDRLKNVEYYTSLSLLEQETKALTIKDKTTGLDKFKCGFFVDNFKSSLAGNLVDPSYRCSIDTKEGVLRPQHYTTSLDLLLGSEAIVGVASTSNPTADYNFVTNLGSPNVVKVGKSVCLKYTEVIYVENKFATRVENINPFAVVNWVGSMELNPESDTWIDTSIVKKTKESEGNYSDTIAQFGIDTNTGLSPIEWGAWETNWTGEKVDSTKPMGSIFIKSDLVNETTKKGKFVGGKGIPITTTKTYKEQYTDFENVTSTKTGTKTSKGIQYKVTESWQSIPLGPSIVSTDTILTLRSRNIEFIAKRMKPNTQVYAFFDNVDVASFIVPKLLEVKMSSGTFSAGETVVGQSGSIAIKFRLANANHKYGPYNKPDQVYTQNPYKTSEDVSTNYSTTTTILNVDCASLQLQSESSFYGYVVKNMKLTGQSSGAVAVIENVRLLTDKSGTIIGSLHIPDPKLPSNPKFETGPKTFTLTSSGANTTIAGTVGTVADGKFTSAGTLNNVEDVTLKIKNAKVEKSTLSKSENISETTTKLVASTSFKDKVTKQTRWVDPLAQSFEVVDENGVFITKCDIYFYTKDQNELPVTMQIRTMETGLPTTTIVPFGETVLFPNQINTSDDGTKETTFTFPSPVYLDPGAAYCVVLLSASHSYQVFISRMGEEDVTTKNKPESEKILVSQQPLLGSLFKSQNGATWDPSQYEDLKLKLYRGNFVKGSSNVRFYNPKLDVGNKQVCSLSQNPIECIPNTVVVGTSKSFTSSEQTALKPGVTILQVNNNKFSGKLKNVLGSIGVGKSLTLINPGSAFTSTPTTYNNVKLVSLSGTGVGGIATVQVGSGGTVLAVTVASVAGAGGTGYAYGDALTIDTAQTAGLGKNLIISIPETVGFISAFNTLVLDRCQGQLIQNNTFDLYYVGTGGTSTISGATVNTIQTLTDGLHFRVLHRNHGMYSYYDYVTLSGVESNIKPQVLQSEYSSSSTSSIPLNSVGIFTSFENVPVDQNNPGYLIINSEVIKYTSFDVATSVLTGITRGIDNTKSTIHPVNSQVFKYELNGVSLRRINKTHYLADTTQVKYPSDTDYYYIKLNMTQSGEDRTVGNAKGYPELFFNESKTCGSYEPLALAASEKTPKATQNIPMNQIRPNIGVLMPAQTGISAKVRTVSGGSPDNNAIAPFLDQGFEQVSLTSNNIFSSPRIICSQINEDQHLTTLPGKKSFTMEFTLTTEDEKVTPMIDLERVNIITTANRINNKILNYAKDPRINGLLYDPHVASYVTKIVNLEKSSDNLKVMFDAFRHSTNDIRVMYKLFRTDADETAALYELFPGYDNLTEDGEVINQSNNNGKPDKLVVSSTTADDLQAYEFTAKDLAPFNGFQVKIMMSGTNSSFVPQISELRVIATA